MSRDLYRLFCPYGQILSVHIMINPKSGVTRGYGFVSYSSREEALLAKESMNGYQVKQYVPFSFRISYLFLVSFL
jgi:RNA recognition motif-containing protein